jgi:hypothetical protein
VLQEVLEEWPVWKIRDNDSAVFGVLVFVSGCGPATHGDDDANGKQ